MGSSVTDDDLAPAPGATVAPPPAADDLAPAPGAPISPPTASRFSPMAPAIKDPSLLDAAKATAGEAALPFIDLFNGLRKANRVATQAMVHPVDTYHAVAANPGAYAREGLRGVNDNIPFAGRAVEALGGIPAESPQDAALAPGVREFGGVAGMPIGSMAGGIAAKGVEAIAPAASHFVQTFAKAADERQLGRAMESLEDKTFKRTRAGIRQGTVEGVVGENPELLKAAAAGNDKAVAKAADIMRKQAGSQLDEIYRSAKPSPDALATPIENMDRRIAALRKGTSSDAEVARQLKVIRDELNDRLGTEDSLNPKKLRSEQSDYQKKGYGKAMPGDDAATARIAANREASMAVGDAVVNHVTGMNYAEAKAFAEANPNSVAARLFKANDQINAANRIEAGIADRSSRAVPEHGIKAMAKRIGRHAVEAAVVGGTTHSPTAALATVAGSEALHLAPAAARMAARTADAGISRVAPAIARGIQSVPDSALARTILGLMKRGIPQETAVQMARSGVVAPPAALRPELATEAPPDPLVL